MTDSPIQRRDARQVLRREILRQADGGFLYRTRKLTGLSQGAIEARTGVDVTVISRLETGLRELKADLEVRLLAVYQDLLGDSLDRGADLREELQGRRARVRYQVSNAGDLQALEALLRYYKERRTYASSREAVSGALHTLTPAQSDDSGTLHDLKQQAQQALDRAVHHAEGMDAAEAALYLTSLRNLVRSAGTVTATQLDHLESTAASLLFNDILG